MFIQIESSRFWMLLSCGKYESWDAIFLSNVELKFHERNYGFKIETFAHQFYVQHNGTELSDESVYCVVKKESSDIEILNLATPPTINLLFDFSRERLRCQTFYINE